MHVSVKPHGALAKTVDEPPSSGEMAAARAVGVTRAEPGREPSRGYLTYSGPLDSAEFKGVQKAGKGAYETRRVGPVDDPVIITQRER